MTCSRGVMASTWGGVYPRVTKAGMVNPVAGGLAREIGTSWR